MTEPTIIRDDDQRRVSVAPTRGGDFWLEIDDTLIPSNGSIAAYLSPAQQRALVRALGFDAPEPPRPLAVGDVIERNRYGKEYERRVVWVSEDQTQAITVDSDDGAIVHFGSQAGAAYSFQDALVLRAAAEAGR